MSKYRIKREPKPIDESTQYESVEYVRTCKDVVNEARNKNMWVFDPSRKKWYSPEEFSILNEQIVAGNEKFIAQVKVMDPRDGIKAGHQMLLDIHTKLEDFSKRVVDYYRDKK